MNLQELEGTKLDRSSNAFYVSFSDLLLVLCAFFVMLLGMSRVDIGTFERLRVGFSGDVAGTLVELASQLKEIAADQPGVEVSLAEDGVRLDLDTVAFFDTGSADLRDGALDPIRPLLANIIKTQYQIDIEGHTDDQAYYRKIEGKLHTNWSLAGSRASSVIHYFLDFGFSQKRLRLVGYAANKPKDSPKGIRGNELAAARARNRRVSILVR